MLTGRERLHGIFCIGHYTYIHVLSFAFVPILDDIQLVLMARYLNCTLIFSLARRILIIRCKPMRYRICLIQRHLHFVSHMMRVIPASSSFLCLFESRIVICGSYLGPMLRLVASACTLPKAVLAILKTIYCCTCVLKSGGPWISFPAFCMAANINAAIGTTLNGLKAPNAPFLQRAVEISLHIYNTARVSSSFATVVFRVGRAQV